MQDQLPAWNSEGVLPPVSSDDSLSSFRSPYQVTLNEFVRRFCVTPHRRDILIKLLDYRSALGAAGLTRGFQWIDGSFLENIELLEQRSPDDLDIVTFYHLAPGDTQESVWRRNPKLFAREAVRAHFRIDGYFIHLDMEDPRQLVRQTAYWYSVWAHRRDGLWKGFVQVDLSRLHDQQARNALSDEPKSGGDDT